VIGGARVCCVNSHRATGDHFCCVERDTQDAESAGFNFNGNKKGVFVVLYLISLFFSGI
jgi:hypothetical protein